MPDRVRRILIVDDDSDIVANLADILTDLGYETDTAPTGEDAIIKIQKHGGEASDDCYYDLCLLDYRMPGINGVELVKAVRSQHPTFRAIMITAYAGDDGVQQAVAAGTWRVLRKPVNIEKLLSMIGEAIS